ncbi:hypothetical protein RNI52_34625 [Labrys neptuniae]|uniref:hypothetical protein n=1 Tax=Labrys neptuniae TaxID=376174 RepID=UPI00288CA2B1|nr:hypothetical protein [Labrys neptuniae]MDT3382513.1 hypothetical protein [Labrys neptuniae]
MTTIPITHFPAQLPDGALCHVIGVDPDSLPPRFVIMRHDANGLLVPDLVHAVAGVSLDDEESIDG